MFNRRVAGAVAVMAGALALPIRVSLATGEPTQELYPNVFNAPPTGQITGKPNVIVVVHGWTSDPTIWANDTRAQIMNALGADAANWDIWCLDWKEDAADSPSSVAPSFGHQIRAEKQGAYLARTLLNQNYQNIQLIGHSLGGRVIESAATMLKQGTSAPIHTTFLDAYTPSNWDLVYGSTSNFSEHYYNRITNNSLFNPDDAPGTEAKFPNAMNVDVTALHDAMPANYAFGLASWNHNWPTRFYRNSIPGATGPNPPYNGYGYRLSPEAQGANWPLGGYNRATSVTLTPNAAPAITSIDTTWVSNQHTVSLGNLKNSANADVSNDVLTLHAASGLSSWATMTFTNTSVVNFFQFDFQFHGLPGEKTLSFFFYREGSASEEHLLFQADDVNRLGTWESTGKLTYWYFTIQPGTHTLAFRLDTASDLGDVQIRNLFGARVAVPEPGVMAVLGMAGVVAVRRKRRVTESV